MGSFVSLVIGVVVGASVNMIGTAYFWPRPFTRIPVPRAWIIEKANIYCKQNEMLDQFSTITLKNKKFTGTLITLCVKGHSTIRYQDEYVWGDDTFLYEANHD